MKMLHFNQNWSMDKVRSLVKTHAYRHNDDYIEMKQITVNAANYSSRTRDWQTMTFIVPAHWLQKFCDSAGIKDLTAYCIGHLPDKTGLIFTAALDAHAVVMVEFTKRPLPRSYVYTYHSESDDHVYVDVPADKVPREFMFECVMRDVRNSYVKDAVYHIDIEGERIRLVYGDGGFRTYSLCDFFQPQGG